MVEEVKSYNSADSYEMGEAEKALNYTLNYTIKSATTDIDRFQFNTSIARMMELMNGISKYQQSGNVNGAFLKMVVEKLILILSPFAPHFAEESWEQLGNEYSVFNQKWPEFDESALVLDTIEIPVQINGRLAFKITAAADADQAAVEAIVKADNRLEEAIKGKSIAKFIYVKGRICNVVVK